MDNKACALGTNSSKPCHGHQKSIVIISPPSCASLAHPSRVYHDIDHQARMRFLLISLLSALSVVTHALPAQQAPLLRHAANDRTVSPELFSDLEELARVVDISYCVGLTGIGISKPFKCLSRCSEFPEFELVKVRRVFVWFSFVYEPTCYTRHGIPAS